MTVIFTTAVAAQTGKDKINILNLKGFMKINALFLESTANIHYLTTLSADCMIVWLEIEIIPVRTGSRHTYLSNTPHGGKKCQIPVHCPLADMTVNSGNPVIDLLGSRMAVHRSYRSENEFTLYCVPGVYHIVLISNDS